VLSSLKDADRKREDDSKRNADEIRSLRDLIPKALEGQKDATDTRLKNLGEELKSLSKLISNRIGSSTGATPSPTTTTHRPTASGSGNTPNSFQANGTSTAAGASSPALPLPSTNGNVLGSSTPTQNEAASSSAAVPERSQSMTSTSNRFGSGAGKASIPAWQMAAAKKNAEATNGEKKDTSTSGTAVQATS
jgi:peroxin-14